MRGEEVIKIGMVDLHTSHVVQFSQRLNHIGVEEEQWVEGGKVILAYQGSSKVTERSQIEKYTQAVEECGVRLVGKAEEMIGKIDAVLVESQEGSAHLEQVRPFLEAGIPAFVDKPFACSVEDAKAMAELAERNGVAIFSSSSLRYTPEVLEVKKSKAEIGRIVGVDAYSPATLHPENPGLFHYGIHAVEVLYALMGPGCEAVWTVRADGAEVVTGLWKDGRIGAVRGTREGSHSYGFVLWGEKEVQQSVISTDYLYRNLLREIISTFKNGKAALDIKETVEIIAFIEAADESARKDGLKVALPGI
jgi:hypothetical protein